MTEEIFSFSIVRNPQRIPAEKLKTSVIHPIDEAKEKYSVYSEFLDVKKRGGKGEEFLKLSERILKQKASLKILSGLKTKIADFDEWVLAQKKYGIEKNNFL